MATFKVGDRVRLIGHCIDLINVERGLSIGAEGVVMGALGEGSYPGFHRVIFECPSSHPSGEWSIAPYQLAPLTPPDTWAESKVRDLFKPQYIEPMRERVNVD